jgi:histone H3/H4
LRLATVQKLISELLPPELTFAKESRDLLIECCVEFIHLVSSEANEICERETKKTISADHVVKALVELGFEDYVAEIQEIAVEHKEQQKVPTSYLQFVLIGNYRFGRKSRTNFISRVCRKKSYKGYRKNC